MGTCSDEEKSLVDDIEYLIKCTYEIKDIDNETQIINYRNENNINEEIESKIKILENGEKRELIFKKKFTEKGLHTINFIIQGKINNMSYMFNDCSSLKIINFTSINTTQVTEMIAMFKGCNELEYLDLSNFNTSNVTDMGWMFCGCNKLKEIKGLKNFNTIKVINMNAMLQDCKELEYLDLSNFNTSNVRNGCF